MIAFTRFNSIIFSFMTTAKRNSSASKFDVFICHIIFSWCIIIMLPHTNRSTYITLKTETRMCKRLEKKRNKIVFLFYFYKCWKRMKKVSTLNGSLARIEKINFILHLACNVRRCDNNMVFFWLRVIIYFAYFCGLKTTYYTYKQYEIYSVIQHYNVCSST